MKELIDRLRKMQREGWATDNEIAAADALERMVAENAQLQKDYTRIKESATLWHDRYKTKCQECVDRQAILGAEIVALEAERDAWQTAYGRADEVCDGLLIETAALREGLDGWHSRYLDCEAERDALKEQMTADRKQFLDMRDERDALRADAERLDWMEDALKCYFFQVQSQPSGAYIVQGYGKKLRAAIDAAIGEKK